MKQSLNLRYNQLFFLGGIMGNFVLSVMESWGYIGICFLIAIENIFPPIPSEVILTFGGFLTTYSEMGPFGVIISATIGSLIGAIVLYYLGYFCSMGLNKLFKSDDINKANTWFKNKGYRAVLYCRFVPIVRSLVSIPAGINKMPMGMFLLYTVLGTIIWNTVLVYAGVFLGDNWAYFAGVISRYSKVVLIGIILIIAFKIWLKRLRKGRVSKNFHVEI